MQSRPLTGLRVVEVAMFAPDATGMHLADLGAEVIKVEAPGLGDPARLLPLDLDPRTIPECGFVGRRVVRAALPTREHLPHERGLSHLTRAGNDLDEAAGLAQPIRQSIRLCSGKHPLIRFTHYVE